MKIFFGLFHTLGDVIVSTSLIRAIKTKYPDSQIVYATSRDYVEVLIGNPDIAEIIPCSHPDEVILNAGAKAYDRTYLPLMRTTEDTLWHQRYPWCVDNGDNHNLVDFYASRCNDDIKIEDRRSFLYPKQEHWDELVKNIPEQSREKFANTPFITFHTTSRNQSKDWHPELWFRLINKIRAEYGDQFAIYQIGGPQDKALPPPSIGIMGTPLLITAAMLSRSLLHLDVDSGPSFIADSVGTKTICIMGATWHQTSGPISNNVTFIEPANRECLAPNGIHTPCHTQCLIKRDCVNTVTVDQVFEEVKKELAAKGINPLSAAAVAIA